MPVVAIGKIEDLFAGRGMTRRHPHRERRRGDGRRRAADARRGRGLIFANLVDFDTQYGHRNDVEGYAGQPRAVRRAPRASCCRGCATDDLLIITADHGNDPTTPSTDHSREYVPLLVAGPRVRAGVDLGTRDDVRRPRADARRDFGVAPLAHGTSFLREIIA